MIQKMSNWIIFYCRSPVLVWVCFFERGRGDICLHTYIFFHCYYCCKKLTAAFNWSDITYNIAGENLVPEPQSQRKKNDQEENLSVWWQRGLSSEWLWFTQPKWNTWLPVPTTTWNKWITVHWHSSGHSFWMNSGGKIKKKQK